MTTEEPNFAGLTKNSVDANEKMLRENKEVCVLITTAARKTLIEMSEAAALYEALKKLGTVISGDPVEMELRNSLGRVFACGFTYAQHLDAEARREAEAIAAAMRG